eukprot:g5220.t1 g5220   contig2:15892-16482(-)
MTDETSTTAALSNNLMDDQFLMVHLNSCDGIEEFSAWCLMLSADDGRQPNEQQQPQQRFTRRHRPPITHLGQRHGITGRSQTSSRRIQLYYSRQP